ncbi:MAG: hypothetical protein ABI905_18260 [Betaproteobacteria bacterium]
MRVANLHHFILVTTVCALTTSCIPFVTLVDYVPEMEGGVIRRTNCTGAYSIEYRVKGIRTSASIAQRSALIKEPSLRFNIGLPAGRTGEFMTKIVQVTAEKSGGRPGAEVAIEIAEVRSLVFDRTPLLPENRDRKPFVSPLQTVTLPVVSIDKLPVMVGEDIQWFKANQPRNFYIDVPLGQMLLGDVRVQIPDIRIDGSIEKIPPIKFRREPRVEFFVPLNC